MRKSPVILRWMCIFVLIALLPLTQASGQAAGKKPVPYDAYAGWRSIQNTQLTRDGAWLAYVLAAQEGDGELVVRNLKTDKEFREARGTAPVLTVDGKFAVYAIVPPKEEVDKAKKDKKKPEEMPKNNLGILNLATGEVATVERVKSFKVAEDAGTYLAYLMEPPAKAPADKEPAAKTPPEKKEPAVKPEAPAKTPPAKEPSAKDDAKKKKEKKHEPGNDLNIRDLASGTVTTIKEATDYAWNKPGTWLAVTVMAKKPEDDGLYVFSAKEPQKGAMPLLKGQGSYKAISFDEKGGQLAFASERDEWKNDASAFKLYYWAEGTPAAVEIASAAAKGMPAGMAVSENGRTSFAKDGTKLFFGYAPIPKADPEDAPEPVKVDIWNWKDPELQPMQKVQADDAKKRSFQAVIHLKERKLVPLAGPDLPAITLSEDAKLALGTSDLPYRQLVSWDQSYSDAYLVSLADGTRKKVLEKSGNGATISPGANYLLYYKDEDRNWYAYRVLDGKVFNLTAKLGVHFENEDHDTPDDPRPYGTAGWTEGDKSVLIYDRYDIWDVKPDGSGGRMVTNGFGRKNALTFRYARLDRDERTVPLKAPLLLMTTDEKTKASGYYRVTLAAPGDPAKVAMLDKRFGGLQKAKNAETYLFTLSRFEEFPNLWVSGPDLTDMKKLSDANPQQAQYIWGKSELIHYINDDGVTLEAILTKPEDFDPSKKYPMMVYIYEKLAAGLHGYVAPGPGTSINVTRYVSHGYVVLQPDIIYEIGYPGSSAMKCVLPAVQKIVGEGYIDPKRIGIQGHSWGGYEITYMITQTDIFAAVEAGASVSNMTSAYGGIRWGTGMSRAFQYEKTQSRIGAPLWTRALQFIENSPLFWVERVKTPYLTIHNDDDDAVPWYQGIEFFSALRHLGKEAYMFVYNGEKHGLRDRENQKHWTVHMDEFFDHYLQSGPLPSWMDKGVPYLEKGKRDVTPLYKKEAKK